MESAASATASNMIPTAATTTSSSPSDAIVVPASETSSAQAAAGRATVQATGSLTAQPNTHYQVTAAGAGTVDIVLPTTHLLQVGDVVSVRGASGSAWRMLPGWSATVSARARTYPFYISTAQLPGNSAPGQVWKQRLDRKAWQWVATEQEGSVMVAADSAGQLHVSSDAGETWTAGNSPAGNWVSVSMTRMTWANPSGAAGQVSIVAAAQGGGLYRSNGDGNWTPLSAASGVDLGNRNWVAVDISDGQVVTAAEYNGPIYNGAAPATATDGAPLVRAWRGLSRGAGTMAAVNEEGEVHVSLDGGKTFALRNVNVGGVAVSAQWHKVAVSNDGKNIAVAGRTASALYLSRDAGLTWTRTAAPVGDYAAIALSGDGQSIGIALSGSAGGVQMSSNGGASFAALPVPGDDTDWRAFAMSEDGKQLVAAGRGADGSGQLVTSLGDRTAYASGKGAITAGASDSIEVEYMGNMRYQVRQSSKGPFSIR